MTELYGNRQQIEPSAEIPLDSAPRRARRASRSADELTRTRPTDAPRISACESTQIVNVMTIDVEDYFHVSVFDGLLPRLEWPRMESRVCRNTERLLDILAEYNVRATFFVLGWVAERFPELVPRIASAGHEIASHGYAHRLIYDQTPEAFRQDVRRAKALLEDAWGRPVGGYRAPSYSITPRSLWALDILLEEGYRYDSSIFPIRHDRYGIPVSQRQPYRVSRKAGTLVEVPASTTRVGPINLPIAGGGYFRILPYWWIRWGIGRVNRSEEQPAVFYLHPWEIDPGQPRLPAGWVGRFRHYRNLHLSEGRLRRLLADFRFSTMESLVSRVSQETPRDNVLPYCW
jgi:polysaccharide deacetylase family protein (PEP-CTERM system associated)